MQELHAGSLEGHLSEDKTLGNIHAGAVLLARDAGGCGSMDSHLLSVYYSRVPPTEESRSFADCGVWFSHAGSGCGHFGSFTREYCWQLVHTNPQ